MQFLLLLPRSVDFASSSSREELFKIQRIPSTFPPRRSGETFIFVIVHKSLIFAWLRHRVVASILMAFTHKHISQRLPLQEAAPLIYHVFNVEQDQIIRDNKFDILAMPWRAREAKGDEK